MAAAGYDTSLSGSAASAASLSGATSLGANYNFGTAYGPGGLVLTDQRGSVGANAGPPSSAINWVMMVGFAVVAAVVFFLPKK